MEPFRVYEAEEIMPTLWAFTPETVFPSNPALSRAQIKLVDDFFVVVDHITQDPDAAAGFVPLFTKDGVWKTPSAAFRGSEELSQSGYTWTFLKERKSMRHWVTKVFVNDVLGGTDEIMMLCRIRIENKDDSVVDVPFAAWVMFETGDDGKVRLKWFQGWSSRV